MRPGELLASRIREVPVAVLDLEMTGLSPRGDRICEVAVVRAEGGEVVREYQTLVVPSVPMSEGAMACHGITDRMLFGAPVFGEIAGDVVRALQGAVVVAHNVEFDMGFLHREIDGAPVVLPPPVTLDTLLMARRLFAFRSNRLASICKQLEISLTGAHRALADARATHAVFVRMCEALDPHNEVTVQETADLVGSLARDSPTRLRHQQIIRDAHASGRSIHITYRSTSDPLAGLVAREVSPWFVRLPKIQGFCHLRQSERVFRLDRIHSVSLGEREVVVPTDAERRV